MSVIKILKEGESDIDSNDIWRFSFHSDFPVFKIFDAGSHDITILANQTDAGYIISHNLGYLPIFFAFLKFGSITIPVFGYGDSGLYGVGIKDVYGDDTMIIVYTELTETTLKIGVQSAPYGVKNNVTFTVSWMIMLDEF